MRCHYFLAGLLIAVLSGCALPDMEAGKRATLEQDYETAFHHYQPLADRGFPQAKLELGKLYLSGKGAAPDTKKALSLFEEARDLGDRRQAPHYIARAQTKLGAQSIRSQPGGLGPAKGIELLQAAAAQSNPNALFELGYAYEKGYGVKPYGRMADMYYEKSGDLGYGRADYQRAQMYQQGRLVPKDEQRAIELYRKAAKNNYPRARQALEKLYAKARGAPAKSEVTQIDPGPSEEDVASVQ